MPRAKPPAAERQLVEVYVSSEVNGCYLIALANDNTLWQFRWSDRTWVPLPDLPAGERQMPSGLPA